MHLGRQSVFRRVCFEVDHIRDLGNWQSVIAWGRYEELAGDVTNRIVINGSDKQAVGAFASDVRKVRKPEPYKGKGIRYEGEVVKKLSGQEGSVSRLTFSRASWEKLAWWRWSDPVLLP